MKAGFNFEVFMTVYFLVIGAHFTEVLSLDELGSNDTNSRNVGGDGELNITVEDTTNYSNMTTKTTKRGKVTVEITTEHKETPNIETVSDVMTRVNEEITTQLDTNVTFNTTTVRPIKMFKMTYKYFMTLLTSLAKIGIIKFYTFTLNNDTVHTVNNDTEIIIKWSEYVEMIRTLYLNTPHRRCTPPVGDSITGLRLPFADHARAMQIYVAAVLCAIGAIGNILSFIVLSRQRQNTSVFTMRCLAVADCVYLMWNGIWEVLYWIYGHTLWMDKSPGAIAHDISLAYPYVSTVGYMLQMTSVWLVVLVTVDRCVAVCLPLRAVSLCTIFRARILCLSVFIMSVLYHIPMFFEWKMEWVSNTCTRQFEYALKPTNTGENFYYQLIYGFILNLMFKNVVPILIVFILNIILIRVLFRAKKARMEIQSGAKANSKQEREITVTLLAVSTILVICLIPRLALKGMRLVLWIPKTNEERIAQFGSLDAYDDYYWSSNYLFIASVFLMRFSSAINFFVYCIVRKDFRNELTLIFSCGKTFGKSNDKRRLGQQSEGTQMVGGGRRKAGAVNGGFSSTMIPDESNISSANAAPVDYGESIRL